MSVILAAMDAMSRQAEGGSEKLPRQMACRVIKHESLPNLS